MKAASRLAVLLISGACLVAAGPKGTVPRTAAHRYPAHGELGGVAVGAVLLTADQARHAFASDVNKCCAVVEVAVYPELGKSIDVSLDDFTMRVAGTDIAAKPSSAKLVAATLQKSARSQRDIAVSPSVEVGYESGRYYDPATGRVRGGGVYTGAGVGVSTGAPGMGPASTDRDRDTMELELGEKGIPEGSVSKPVAGYLYFHMPRTKKNAVRDLEYSLNGTKVVLHLP